MKGIYITKTEESLQRLAAKFYGDWTLWKLIFDTNYNILKNYPLNQFPSGLSLKIPNVNLLDETYIILKDDTYEKISLEFYGTESYSEFIKHFNQSKILKYHIGEELLIPSLIQNKKGRINV